MEHVETEDQFLERYAKTARELQEEAVEKAENGQDEDGHKIELGMIMLALSFVFIRSTFITPMSARGFFDVMRSLNVEHLCP